MNVNKTPLVSVLLPVYNAEKYLAEAINSILEQTFRDFEFIIINDGSKDKSLEIVRSFSDPRIIVVDQENIGLAATLNKGIELAKGKYIARQDNDDISLPQRLEQQAKFMEENPEVSLLGTAAEIINDKGMSTGRFHHHPVDSFTLKYKLLFNNPFVHSSVMIRRSVLDKTGNYSTDISVFEDYNLWSRIARVSPIANLRECLVKYREVDSGMSKSTANYVERVKNQSAQNISFYCPDLTEEQINLFLDQALLLEKFKTPGESFSFYKQILTAVIKGFCGYEKVKISRVDPLISEGLLNFRRKIYNTVIYSDNFGFFEKLKAKVYRKFLFVLHKEALN